MSGDTASNQRVLAVLGGASVPPSLLAAWANSATFISAADSGADALLEAGITPHLVVGDLDSLEADLTAFPDVRQDLSEASTDCDKLLAALAASGHSSVTLINVTGDLPDHELAILHSAARSGLTCRLVFGRGFGYILVGPARQSFAAEGRVSLLPLTRCAGVSLAGVKWPLTQVELDPMGATSISNESAAPFAEVALKSGAAFVFIEAPSTPSWPG